MLTLGASTASAFQEQSGERNVLLIIADDVGVDMVGQPYVDYYNKTIATDDDITVGSVGVPRTLTVSKLKKSGVAFLNNWACPTCSPTRASLFTGMYAHRHGITDPSLSDGFTDGGYTTVAQELGAAGYATAIFGKWHLGEASGHGPVDNGWDLHQGFLGGAVDSYYDWDRVDSSTGLTSACTTYAPTQTVTDALAWIKKQPGRWMATVALNAAHTSEGFDLDSTQVPPTDCPTCYTPADPDEPDQVFRATVEYMDFQIGRLLKGIPSAQLDITTIIFLCDNGTDARFTEHFDADSCKGSLREGGINTALIIADGCYYRNHAPKGGVGRVVGPNRFSKAIVNVVDLFATIADIAGAGKTTAVDSVSLIPLLENSATKVRNWNFVYASSDHDGWTGWAVRGTQTKLIEQDDGTQELFKLAGDRWEVTNLWSDPAYGATKSQLQKQAANFLK